MDVKYILFDLDGTLMDTSVGVIKALDYVVDTLGLVKVNEEVKKTFIGPPIYEVLKKHYHMSEEASNKATEMFRQAYKDIFLFDAVPYDGIYDLLVYLKEKGYKLGVATNKRNDYAIRLLKEFEFDRYFDYMLGSDFENTLKKADIIRICLEKLGCTRKEYTKAVMVGDTIHDLNGSQAIGIQFVGVSYGFGFKCQEECRLLKDTQIFSRTMELKEYFSKL